MNWWTWRVVIAEETRAAFADVRRKRFVELYEAHLVLDCVEEMRAAAEAEAERKAGR